MKILKNLLIALILTISSLSPAPSDHYTFEHSAVLNLIPHYPTPMIFDFLNKKPIEQISAHDANNVLNSSDHIFLDVRRQDEIDEASIPGSLKVMMTDLNEENLLAAGIDVNNPEAKIIIYCHSGGRSQRACRALDKWGYENVANLAGGIVSWVELGFETESADE